ncbi:dihydrofolate reductase [Coemansia sp. RSA 1822]|nr:dihydrofolate reductase [Coemansia sp. RSA 638]KAJ2540686.1 dihydrofolate reductase [Coemansia sp. RSA 1853]KAJ2560830.1 dihydrofolate reductase [Coemansia sp. RSA 1822]
MLKKPVILVAAAAATNNGIGVSNGIPWRLRKELAYFNKVTQTVTGLNEKLFDENRSNDEKLLHEIPTMNVCIMGRRTWESIPLKFRPLTNRYNIVITSNPQLLDSENPQLTTTQPSIEAALEHVDELNASNYIRIDRVFIVGGSGIYASGLQLDTHVQVLLTKVQFADAHTCDTFFPAIDERVFELQPHARLEQVAGFNVPQGVQTENNIDYEFFLFEKRR